MPVKMTKREFIAFLAEKNQISYRRAEKIYNMVFDGLESAVLSGRDLTLTGFGRFYLQKHRGHKIRGRGADGLAPGTKSRLDDYLVVKFSASEILNRKARSME